MTLTLIIAILFTAAVVITLFTRKTRYWWLIVITFAIAAGINWLRYFEVIR